MHIGKQIPRGWVGQIPHPPPPPLNETLIYIYLVLRAGFMFMIVHVHAHVLLKLMNSLFYRMEYQFATVHENPDM